MKLEAVIKSVIEDGDELSVSMVGWAASAPEGTLWRGLGTLNIPSTARNRKAYYIGRRLMLTINPERGTQ